MAHWSFSLSPGTASRLAVQPDQTAHTQSRPRLEKTAHCFHLSSKYSGGSARNYNKDAVLTGTWNDMFRRNGHWVILYGFHCYLFRWNNAGRTDRELIMQNDQPEYWLHRESNSLKARVGVRSVWSVKRGVRFKSNGTQEGERQRVLLRSHDLIPGMPWERQWLPTLPNN